MATGDFMKYVYPAIFIPVEDLSGYYFIKFPDIENAVAQGKNLDDAKNMAWEILNLALIEMEDDGEQIPLSTDFKFFKLDANAFVEEIEADTDSFRKMLELENYFVHYDIWYSPVTNKKFFVYKDDDEEICEKLCKVLKKISGLSNNE